MRYLILIAMVLGMTWVTIAQQSPTSNFYNFNEYLLNPAEAGNQNRLQGMVSQRLQWRGIDGAPTTTFAGFHGALNDKMGLGVKVILDQTDILQQFSAAGSYAYRIQINEKSKLNFGVSGMMLQNSINYSDAVVGNFADEVLSGGDQAGMTFDAEAGILFEYQKFKFGIAANHLFESGVDYELPDDRGTATFERIRQYSAYTSYLFEFSDLWGLEPFILIRNQGPETFQYEVNALSNYKETLYLGAGYRQDAGYIVRAAFQITDNLIAGYAYEFSNSGIASYSSGSHEFMLGLKIGKKTNEGADGFLDPIPEKPPVVENKIEELDEKEEANVPETKIEEEKVESEIVEEVKTIEPMEKEIPISVEAEQPEKAEQSTPSINQELFEQTIQFDFEKTELSEEAKSLLDQIAKELIEFPNKVITVFGHTCDMGSDRINLQFSNQRADIVKDYLIKKGVDQNQIKTKAMLDEEPLVPNTSIENRQKNRRVEFELN